MLLATYAWSYRPYRPCEHLSSKTNPYYSPETWKEVALCDVASGFEYGMNAAATVYDGSHKYIRITDIE